MSTLTKVFVILQLVFSLALAVVLVIGISRLKPYQENLAAAQKGQAAAQAALAMVQNSVSAKDAELTQKGTAMAQLSSQSAEQINKLQAQITQDQMQLASYEARNAQLTSQSTQLTAVINSVNAQLAEKDKEVSTIRPEIVSLTQKNADLNRTNNTLQTQVRYAEQAIRKLQEQIAQGPTTNGATAPGAEGSDTHVSQLPATGTPTASQINGKIIDITQSAGHTLIEVPLGKRDGVKVNTQFTIYRNAGNQPKYVGDAVVERVSPDQSVARVTENPDGPIQKGDLVISGSNTPQ